MALVRDMYGGQDTSQWSKYRRKGHRNNQLDTHRDVLFKIYKPVHPPTLENLCDLLFRPKSDPVHWMKLIRNRYDNITVQWTLRQVTAPLRNVISITGGSKELQRFCAEFPQNLEDVNATANEIPDNNEEEAERIQELEARIQELQLENIVLRTAPQL